MASGILLLAVGRRENATVTKWVALIGSIIGFAVTIPLMTQFDNGTAAMQFVEHASWIERFNVFYHLGVDGISMVRAADRLHHHHRGAGGLGSH